MPVPASVTTIELPITTPGSPPPANDAVAAAPSPVLLSGPAAVLSLDPSLMPLPHSLPALPAVAATPIQNTAAAALGAAGKSPLSLDGFDFSTPQTSRTKPGQQGGLKRTISRLVLLGILGAGGYFGYTKGPALYDQYIRKTADSAAGEADAPQTFPTAPVVPLQIRTAEFTLAGLNGSPDTEYSVTIDFETNVSRVVVTRDQGPNLEVLTFGDAAVVRQAGATQWYQVQRGAFPLDDRLERADWVRTLDELLPLQSRSGVVIDRATESEIAGIPARHLQLSIDPALLPMPEIPLPTIDPATGLPVAESLAVTPAAPLGVDGLPVVPANPATAAAAAPVQIEIWVDANGLVRQITGAPQLGAEKITVVSTTDQAYVPPFPPQEQVLPLTASVLVELGM
jgi:hypothetical protein